MRFIGLTIAAFVSIPLVAGCSINQSLNTSRQERATAQIPTQETDVSQARRLAWEAAVIVQNPPHPVTIWQQARVKWRQAIRLLEAVPDGSELSAPVRAKLATYRVNYAAINARLNTEQAAADKLKAAQTLAWQAAVTVQNPPHSLKVWRRASSKWQEAIALLESIPNITSVFQQSQKKLPTYRDNYRAINQRIITETKALSALKQFSETATRLNNLPTTVLTSQGVEEQVGITYEDYVRLLQTLETSLEQFSQQPEAKKHIIYTDLTTAIEDYKLTLKLWQSYLNFKADNAQWLYGDVFNQVFPISSEDSAMLVQKYGVKTYSGGTKISLRFSAWSIWQQASQHINQAQRKISTLN